MTANNLLKCIAASVRRFGGADDTKNSFQPAFTVPTRYGLLHVHPFCDNKSPWIALRFKDHSTGKVHDTLCGGSFNGYSGKWNIHPSQEGASKNETRRRRLREYCLQEFERRMEAVKI